LLPLSWDADDPGIGGTQEKNYVTMLHADKKHWSESVALAPQTAM